MNKKQSWKNITFEESTYKNLSLFKDKNDEFLFSK